jgi:hypothetical protein
MDARDGLTVWSFLLFCGGFGLVVGALTKPRVFGPIIVAFFLYANWPLIEWRPRDDALEAR